jgi:hypothetical protein
VTNDNFLCHVFGNIGFPYFVRTRKVWMGIAMWSTLLAMFVTCYGALSLSTDPDVVRASYWAFLETLNVTDGARTRYYLGLRSIVTIDDDGDVASDRLELDYVVGRVPGARAVDPLTEELLESCADSAAGNQVGALLSCVTLAFALLGTINRMRFSSDANVQKALGLVTDTWGALALSDTPRGKRRRARPASDISSEPRIERGAVRSARSPLCSKISTRLYTDLYSHISVRYGPW